MRTGGSLTEPWPGFPKLGIAPIPGKMPEAIPPTSGTCLHGYRLDDLATGASVCERCEDQGGAVRTYAITDLLEGNAQTLAAAHPVAWALFLQDMKGRGYGREELTDAWGWFYNGWHAGKFA
jgi:hypothetical protein